ncbi:hypothetical protein F5876DRAFT_67628 [Lentinula aff. lateritia]|uniref:Uncharacterized protein n=1 Tax=Lentinula aff. lateritia TaxID=2804960 RepID=A0ACC1TTR2_9AGAR|nr:hypothetical protein F5876DRAFT_67628 [Lentinula aff. lateritia]
MELVIGEVPYGVGEAFFWAFGCVWIMGIIEGVLGDANRRRSVYNEKSNPVDIPYPFVSGLPMHPSEVIKLHNKGEFFFRCAHGMICEAWYIGLNSANEHCGCAFIRCPKQINHRCGLYDTPTKRFKEIQTQITPSSIPAPFPVKLDSPSIDYPPGSYFLLPPFEDNDCILPEASDDEIVSYFTELCDATVGPKGAVIYDETKQSQGTFLLTSIDIEILIKQLRGAIFNPQTRMEELERHELRLNQQELRLKLKAFKGAGVGPDNQMIGPPDPAFFAMDIVPVGSSKEDPIDVDYVETCTNCSQEIDATLHKELCLGIF